MSDNTKAKCSKCNGTGKVKVVCSTCHNTGEVKCSKCGGKGERKCPHCDGTGHACPVCTRGYVKKDRWINCKDCFGKGYTINYGGDKCTCYKCGGRGQVKETYKAICPNCHGDYTNTDHVCDKCDGKKKISCAKHETCPDCRGKQHKVCPKCKGEGTENKVSSRDIRIFRALGMIGGLFGLHYVYIQRWGLLIWHYMLLVGSTALVLKAALDQNAGSSEDSKAMGGLGLILFAVLLISWLISLLLTKRDGRGGELRQSEFKSGWYWSLAIFFGFTGAHLMYVSSWSVILLCIQMFFSIPFVVTALDFISKHQLNIEWSSLRISVIVLLVITFLGWLIGLGSREEEEKS